MILHWSIRLSELLRISWIFLAETAWLLLEKQDQFDQNYLCLLSELIDTIYEGKAPIS